MNCKRCNGTGTEPDQKAIGWKMNLMRVAAGIGLREMAGYMGISHGFLSQPENGHRTWSQRLINLFQRKLTKHTK